MRMLQSFVVVLRSGGLVSTELPDQMIRLNPSHPKNQFLKADRPTQNPSLRALSTLARKARPVKKSIKQSIKQLTEEREQDYTNS